MDRTTSSEPNYPCLSMLMEVGSTCDQRWQASSLEPSLSWRSPTCVSSWYIVLLSLSILDPSSGIPLEEVHLDQLTNPGPKGDRPGLLPAAGDWHHTYGASSCESGSLFYFSLSCSNVCLGPCLICVFCLGSSPPLSFSCREPNPPSA